MSKSPQFSLLFCEDFRIEVGSKPMLIGILSPVVYIDNDVSEDNTEHLNLVTLFTVPENLSSIELGLEVEIHRNGLEVESRSFAKVIDRDPDDVDAEPWGGVIPLPLTIPECTPGTKIEATLSAQCGSTWASLLLISQPEPVAVKPKRERKKLSSQAAK